MAGFLRKGDRNSKYRDLCQLERTAFDADLSMQSNELFIHLSIDPSNIHCISTTRMANFFCLFICNVCIDMPHVLHYLNREKQYKL